MKESGPAEQAAPAEEPAPASEPAEEVPAEEAPAETPAPAEEPAAAVSVPSFQRFDFVMCKCVSVQRAHIGQR